MNTRTTSLVVASAPAKMAALHFAKLLSNPVDMQKGLFQSKISSSVIGDSSQFVAKQVSNLFNPISPSSLPFAHTEKAVDQQLFDATASVKILTSQVAMHMDMKLREKIFKQIDSLHDLDEWNMDDRPVLVRSFASFLKMILQIKPHRHPGLGLTYEGHLIAAWTTGKDRLTIEFFPNNRVRWVLSSNSEGETERAAGETVVSLLYSRLMPYRPDHWFFE